MKWKPIPANGYALLSDCGCYSVCKVGGANGVMRYSAWRTAKHPEGRKLLMPNLPDAATAKTLCEGDK